VVLALVVAAEELLLRLLSGIGELAHDFVERFEDGEDFVQRGIDELVAITHQALGLLHLHIKVKPCSYIE